MTNANGVAPSSPGLRGTSYPGAPVLTSHNPNGVASHTPRAATPLGLFGCFFD